MDEEFSQAFHVLKPLCVTVAEGGSRQDVKTLREVLPAIQKDALQNLQDYVLFPLRLRLRICNNQQEITRDLVECICEVLSRTSAVSWKSFYDLFTEVVILIGHPKDSGKLENLSDELKLAVVKCISTLLDNANSNLVEDLYRPEFIPQLGHAIFVMLQLAENETSRALRLAAVNCLLAIGLNNHKVDASLQKQMGRIFASFLPGISMTLTRIITGDSIQGHSFTVASLQAWSHFVALVLNDDTNKDEEKIINSESCKVPLVTRSASWVQETATKLGILVDKICDLVCHSHWRVRLALVEWAGVLLLKCAKSFSNKEGPLLDILLTLVADDMEKVNNRSREVLRKVANAYDATDSLTETLEENLMSLVTRLPRILRSGDDDKKLATLHLLIGYIELLGPRIQTIFLSLPHLERLGLALMQLVDLDCTNVQMVSERAMYKDPDEIKNPSMVNAHLVLPKKFFVHFRDERVFTKTMFICRLLGCYGNLELLFDYLLDLFRESAIYRKQAVLLMNEVLLGAAGIDIDEAQAVLPHKDGTSRKNSVITDADSSALSSIVRLLLEEYLQPFVWHLPTHLEDEAANNVQTSAAKLNLVVVRPSHSPAAVATVQQFNSNVYLLCVMLEGIANCSKVLGPDFKPLLITVLYPLVEKMGSSSAVVSETAHYTAKVICASIECSCVADLIYSNSDYLINSLSKKLRHVLENPCAPSVLKVAIQNSKPEILPLIQSSVEELLYGLDQHHDQTAELFMEPLNALVAAVVGWFPSQGTGTHKHGSSCDHATTISSVEETDSVEKAKVIDPQVIRDFFLEHHRLKQIADECFDEDGNEVEGDNASSKEEEDIMEDEPSKKTLPVHVTLVVQILERCTHCLSSRRQQLALLILDTIREGAVALQDWTDELLPMVHKVWQPLARRFDSSNLVIMRKAFNTLCVLSEICGDFIWRRTMDDVWSKIVNFLHTQATVSRSKAELHFTVACKLQLDILGNLGLLARQLKLKTEDCENLIVVCVPYLSSEQPKPLQEAAIKVFEDLILLEPDIVWLHLYSICGVEGELATPDALFPVVKAEPLPTSRTEVANATQLLNKTDVLNLNLKVQ